MAIDSSGREEIMDKPHRRQNAHFQKIMVGYDGSKPADKAVEIAFSLAQATDWQVLIFSVARPPEPATMVELSPERETRSGKALRSSVKANTTRANKRT